MLRKEFALAVEWENQGEKRRFLIESAWFVNGVQGRSAYFQLWVFLYPTRELCLLGKGLFSLFYFLAFLINLLLAGGEVGGCECCGLCAFVGVLMVSY